MFTRWSASFWSMRWMPTVAEEGAWQGLSLRDSIEPEEHVRNDAQPRVPHLPLSEQQAGRVPGGRLADPSSCGVYAVTALVEAANPGHLWRLLSALREFRRAGEDFRPLRWNIGSVGPRSFWILTLWRADPEGQHEAVRVLRERLNASWCMGWRAGEYEIGNWNGLRLRQLASARSREVRM